MAFLAMQRSKMSKMFLLYVYLFLLIRNYTGVCIHIVFSSFLSFFVLPLQDEETVIKSFGPFYIVVSSNITNTIITDVNTLFVSITNYTFEVNEVTHIH